jgi:hypothetical protein
METPAMTTKTTIFQYSLGANPMKTNSVLSSAGFLAPSLSKAIANVTADNVACNLARLAHRMTGDHLLAISTVTEHTTPQTHYTFDTGAGGSPPASIVNATVSNSANGTIRILVFHHHPWFNATSIPMITPAQVKVDVCGFERRYGPGPSLVSGTVWKLDDLHGQFWPTWEDDLLMANVNTSVPGDSWVQDGGGPWDKYQNTKAFEVWLAHVKKYQQLSRLSSEAAPPALMNGGCLQTATTLRPHSVVLLEYPTKN